MSLVEVRDEGTIRWIGLNRPGKRNAIDQAMAGELAAALDEARGQPCVVVVHSTVPGSFAAGADIAELRDRDADAAAAGLVDELAADPGQAARAMAEKIARQSWRALELTKLALRSQRPATTTFDLAAQALLFGSQDKYDRMTAFLNRPKK